MDGAGIDSPECRQLRVKAFESAEQASGVPATLLFDANDAFIEHDGPENHYRPYLMLLGRPAGIQADLPHGVSTLRYKSRQDTRMITYRYDFTRENIVELTRKGLFDEGFEPSKMARTSRYELPCEVNYVAFPPDVTPDEDEMEESERADFASQNPPVVFASLVADSLHCDDNTSGYTIHEYFEPVPEKSMENAIERYELPQAARVHGTEFESAFEAKPAIAARENPVREPVEAVPVEQPVRQSDVVPAPGPITDLPLSVYEQAPEQSAKLREDVPRPSDVVTPAAPDVVTPGRAMAQAMLQEAQDKRRREQAAHIEQVVPEVKPAPKPMPRDLSGLELSGSDGDDMESEYI